MRPRRIETGPINALTRLRISSLSMHPPANAREETQFLRTASASNSYTTVCPPVRGDNPLAKACGLSSRIGGQTMV